MSGQHLHHRPPQPTRPARHDGGLPRQIDLATFEPLTRQIVEGHNLGTEAGRLKRDLALRLALLQIHAAAEARPARTDDTKLTTALLAVRENPGALWTVPEIDPKS